MSLAESRPWLVPDNIESLRFDLAEAYAEYTSTVSPDWMAISLESATYLLFLCKALDAHHVADFGSGFTSWILGTYADLCEHSVDAISVDDNEEWLDKTAQFLDGSGLKSELLSWEDYKVTHTGHDVACYDLGAGDVRERGMELVARRTRPGGVILFDDAHHDGHRRQMVDIAERFRWDLFFLQDLTTDSYGRFGALMVRP